MRWSVITAVLIGVTCGMGGLGVGQSTAQAAQCRDAAGKFTKCPKVVHCRSASGKFVKCGAPGAKPG